MLDALTTITHLINSPPGQLAAGGVLAGIVWKFFERVESVLNENTKLEIAVWLVGRKPLGPKVEPWPSTFAKLFDRVFGTKHLSWKCFARSCVVSLSAFLVAEFIIVSSRFWISLNSAWTVPGHNWTVPLKLWQPILVSVPVGLILPDFVSLLETRLVLGVMRHHSAAGLTLGLLVADLCLTIMTASLGSIVGAEFAIAWFADPAWSDRILDLVFIPGITIRVIAHPILMIRYAFSMSPHHRFTFSALMAYPGCFSSIWLWLYAGSGFLLKAARRFDIGFEWFNRHFDIEKKPLQSIGLVAGALVAVVYWAVVIVSRVVG